MNRYRTLQFTFNWPLRWCVAMVLTFISATAYFRNGNLPLFLVALALIILLYFTPTRFYISEHQ